MMSNSKLCAGDWVEVLGKEEILLTLDHRGQLGGLPFMPEMFSYCGKRFRVYKRAHKTCDTVNDYKGLRMDSAVHLEGNRCLGLSHGGCEAACLIFWKEAWLKRVPGPTADASESSNVQGPVSAGQGCTEAEVMAGTTAPGSDPADPAYVCQATLLPAATVPLKWWELDQYIEDLTSGNIGPWRMFKGIVYIGYTNLSNLGIGIGAPMRWIYERFQALIGGVPYPRRIGTIPAGERTPASTLNLQPGEMVRMKSYPEILATLDAQNKNRGLYFDAEVVPYCGGTYRVVSRVNQIIHERTGKMIKLKNSVILEGVFCQSRYSNDRLFCPRSLYQFMHEIWLERVTADDQTSAPGPVAPAGACAAKAADPANRR